MIDHDRLFKELLSTFFLDFVELFLPEVLPYLDTSSLNFLDKEVFTDVTAGKRYETDLIVEAKFLEQQTCFLIHVEHQSETEKDFSKRMFRYFARLYEKYDLPIYPVVLYSQDSPKRPEPDNHKISFPDRLVLDFRYRVIQLNRLNWRDFVNRPNPVASALMAKMGIAKQERAKVKVECLRLLATLKLDPARMQLISGFIDTYLSLNEEEEKHFQEELTELKPKQQEDVMEIVTSWMEKGLEQGIHQGMHQGQATMVIGQLTHKLGGVNDEQKALIESLSVDQLDALGKALLDFNVVEDLVAWLEHASQT